MTKERVLTLALKQLEIEILKECNLIAKIGNNATFDGLEKLFAERMELKQEMDSDSKTPESGTDWLQFYTQKVQNIQKCIQGYMQELLDQPESETGKEVI